MIETRVFNSSYNGTLKMGPVERVTFERGPELEPEFEVTFTPNLYKKMGKGPQDKTVWTGPSCYAYEYAQRELKDYHNALRALDRVQLTKEAQFDLDVLNSFFGGPRS